MKIVLVLGAIILCTPVLLFAQSSIVPWTKDQPCCTYDVENGIWTTKYSDKNIQIEVMSPRFGVARGDFEVFWVFVKNNGLPRFELNLAISC